MLNEGGGVDTDIHLVTVERTVGGELEHRFLEIEIPHVPQGGCYTRTLLVQGRRAELRTLRYQAPVALGNSRYCRFGDIYLVMTDHVRLPCSNEIRQINLALLHFHHRIYGGVEITHVIHLLAQLLHTDCRQLRIINHRRFAHLLCVPG